MIIMPCSILTLPIFLVLVLGGITMLRLTMRSTILFCVASLMFVVLLLPVAKSILYTRPC